MEERESLKRQIELLQNLINKHKSIYGDSPSVTVDQSYPDASTSARGRGHSTSIRGRPYALQSRGSWRKTYSLRNKNPQSSVGHPSACTSSSVDQCSSQDLTHTTLLPSYSRAQQNDETKTTTVLSENTQQKKEGHTNSIAWIRDDATTAKHAVYKRSEEVVGSQHEVEKGKVSVLASAGVQQANLDRQTLEFHQNADSKCVVLLEEKVIDSSEVPSVINTSTTLQSSSEVQVKHSLTNKTSTDTKQATTQALILTDKIPLLPPTMSKISKETSLNPLFQKSQVQAGASFLKKSKFTWVKSQNMEGVDLRKGSSISLGKAVTVAPTPISKPGVARGSSPSFTINKKTPAKKLPRKLSVISVAPKTSKYKWVSFSAGAQAKTPQKPLSPKALTLAQRALEKGETTVKLKTSPTPSAKIKKGTSSSLGSQYCWKAGGQGTTASVAGGATAARRRSAFHWTSEKNNKGVKGGLVVSLSLPQRAPLQSSSPGGFKLCSRMKIIRRSASSGCGTEKGSASSAVKYSPRSRIHPSTRSAVGVRRAPTRELVSFGRHKLRRLSPALSGTSTTSSSQRSPGSRQVYRTRYKMVTHPGCSTAHTLHYNSALSWRARKIQSARTFLQSRLRVHHDRYRSSTQPWRGSMCWIRGSLYRVSANKLSRTVAPNMSINRTGRSSSPLVLSMVPGLNRNSGNRHLARTSRAVQRSLAIIRHARQKKPQKQYCMYYNRFGKCNRGNSCPYIHDPDKVAVCTRFLRGTCKQGDGTCPFSHKVAKEKMPVCSYFLRGICNNSDCPYSHVYVSRKADVCKDFVNGYCPAGEKCKKKHTLVCPDFSKTGSCPRGTRCKLQHRQRTKQSASNASSVPAKKTRTKESCKRPRLSVAMPPGSPAATETPATGPLALPSFISLSSSPEEANAPDMLPVETTKVKAEMSSLSISAGFNTQCISQLDTKKKLQIKPRL
ncbi:zinc finger CCCH domain-containing protein 3 isoform X2 [Channa argus]|uniref:zinc finger CCCH domain-containing protein 3 isoform X2 n=1 Tax=Channa argus TaxID=215402 RepID=UPI00351FF54F